MQGILTLDVISMQTLYSFLDMVLSQSFVKHDKSRRNTVISQVFYCSKRLRTPDGLSHVGISFAHHQVVRYVVVFSVDVLKHFSTRTLLQESTCSDLKLLMSLRFRHTGHHIFFFYGFFHIMLPANISRVSEVLEPRLSGEGSRRFLSLIKRIL